MGASKATAGAWRTLDHGWGDGVQESWFPLALWCACLLAGCTASHSSTAPSAIGWFTLPWNNSDVVFPERLEQGYTIVLPGIWGSAPLDHGIVKGLVDADVPATVELYDWTEGPLLLVYNLRALAHNRIEATKIAGKIVAYQERYPGRPVTLIGYSGGAAVAVLALESLPPGRKVTNAVLLAPTLAPDYDLRTALNHTERGIHSFHSPADAPLLMAPTPAGGTMDGRHTGAAGAVGFSVPAGVAANQRDAYTARVSQQAYSLEMLAAGHPGGHFGWTSPAFVAQWIAPLLHTPVAAETEIAARRDTPLVR